MIALILWIKKNWTYIVIFVLTLVISILASTAMLQKIEPIAIIVGLVVPTALELTLVIYKKALEDIFEQEAKSFRQELEDLKQYIRNHGDVEKIFSSCYDIATSEKGWRAEATESANQALNRCRRDLSNTKDGKLPIHPFKVSKDETITNFDKNALYEKQARLIKEIKPCEELLSIHWAETKSGRERWYEDKYKTMEDKLKPFYKYVVEPNIDAAKRKVHVKRLFITIDPDTIKDGNLKDNFAKLQQWQNDLGFNCRFIAAETIKELSIQIDDILITPTAAISFKQWDWWAEAYDIVGEKELEKVNESFTKLWDNAKETIDELISHG